MKLKEFYEQSKLSHPDSEVMIAVKGRYDNFVQIYKVATVKSLKEMLGSFITDNVVVVVGMPEP